MSTTSSDLQLDNENSYSSRTKGGTEKDRKNTTNWENGKRSSSNSKSETRSVSSKYDDKSEHFERLLRESQQHICNRDAIIDMLQKQLKRIEELYRKTLNQQQDIRQKYANVVLELTRLKVICDQLKTENSTLSRANVETTRRYQYEREGLQDELNTWRQEYEQLVRTINNMEKSTTIMKDILYSDDSYHQQILNATYVEQLLEQYKQIQGALVVQNDKLDKFLEKFHLIGDGGCSIVTSLEGVRCIGKMQSKSLSSIVPDRPKSPEEPEQTPIYAVRRLETPRRYETPPPDVSNDYYNIERRPQKATIDGSMCSHEVSIRYEEDKRSLMKVNEIIQTDSHSSVCCVNMPPMLLESIRRSNSIHSCCEEMLIVPEKFMETSYLAKTPYLIANECLQTCSCSTSDASCCLELISPPVAATEAVQTGPSCESVSDVIPSPIFTTDLAISAGLNWDSLKSIPKEDPSSCSRSCCVTEISSPHSSHSYCDPDDTQNTKHHIETAMQTESIWDSICSAQEKPLSSNTHSSPDQEVVPIPVVPREIAVQTSTISESISSTLREKIPSSSHISEIMPPRPIIKEKTDIFSKEKQPAKAHISRDLKSARTAVVFIETAAKTGSSSENICSFPQRKIPPNSCTGERGLEPTFVNTAAQTKSIPKNSLPRKKPPPYTSRATSGPIKHNIQSLPRERTYISGYSKSAPTSAVSCETQTMIEVNQDELKKGYTSVETNWFPPSTTTEKGTSPFSHIRFLPEMRTPVTMPEASQTESSCRNNCIFPENMAPIDIMAVEEVTQTVSIAAPPTKEETSQTESTCRGSCYIVSDKVPSIVNVEEVTQTVTIVGDSYTAPILLFPPQTTEEASQTESTCKDSYTFIDKVPSIMTVEEVTQTVTIPVLPTTEKALQTESDEVPCFTTVEEFTQTVTIVGDSYVAPKVIPHTVTIEEASQTESSSRDSCTLSDKVPSFTTVEEVTQTVSIAAPSTIEDASQTESRCITVEEIIQTVSTVRDRYTAPEVIHPALTTEEASQTESSSKDSCTLSDKVPSSTTVEEVTQTVSIAAPSTIEDTSQTESRCITVEEIIQTVSTVRDRYTAPEVIHPVLTVEEASQTVSVAGDGCIFPEISPVTAENDTQTVLIGQITTGIDISAASRVSGLLLSVEEATQTASMGQICVTDKESILTLCTIEESTQTAPIGKITTDIAISVPSVQTDSLPSAIVQEESIQTAPIGKITTDTSISASSVQSDFLPSGTVQESVQTVSIDQIAAETGTSSTSLSSESTVAAEETTQTVPIEKITTDTTISVPSVQTDNLPSAIVQESIQTASIDQIAAETGTSSTYLSSESIVTAEESTQTAPIEKITTDTAISVPSVQTDNLPSAIVQESIQTVSIDQIAAETGTSSTYLSSESIVTAEETTQTAPIEKITTDTATLVSSAQSDFLRSGTVQESIQTVSIDQIAAETGTSSTYLSSESIVIAEETTQTAPIEKITTDTATLVSSAQSDFLPSGTVQESVQTVSTDQIAAETGASSTYLSSESIVTSEETTQTAPIGKITTDVGIAVSSAQSDFLPSGTVQESVQTVSIDQIAAETGTSSTYLSSESIVTAEETTQTAPIEKITTDIAISVSSAQNDFVPSGTVQESVQTVSIDQTAAETGTSSTYLSSESIVTAEETTQTAPIEKITTDTAISVSSAQSDFVPSGTVQESVQTVSIDQIAAETGTLTTYLSSESIVTAEESTQTASIRQIITEICASFPSISETIPSIGVEEVTQTESGLYSIYAIPEVVPLPVSIGELAQGARAIPEQQDQSVWVLLQSENEATQIDIFSASASIQTDGKPSTHIDSHKFGISIETQTTADESTQTLNLECTDCCTETELQLDNDLHSSRKLISCHKRSKSNQISRKSSAASGEEQELRVCCFCDDISLTVKPETTDKGICTDFLDSGDGGLLAENERLQQLLLMKDLTIKRLQEESTLAEEVLVEKQKLQDENIALKQDLANIEDELKWLRKKLADVGEEISASENGKDHYISETNELLNEYEASLQELNQKYASAIKENQSLTEEVSVLIEKVNFLNETINQHKEQATLCKLQLENMTEKVKELEDTIRELEQQKEFILDSTDNMDELNPALQELTEQCELLKEENESLLEYNKEVLLLKKKNSNLVHEIDAKDVAIDELQGRIEELQKELDSVKEEMESNNENAKEEMDKLIQVCNELEQKLETTKELLEKEVTLMDEEVNASLGPYSEHTDETLQKQLDEKTEQLQKTKGELENVKDNFEEEISKLDAKNTLLQLQLGKEQLDHRREIETIEEKLTQCHKEYVSAVVSCSDFGSSDSSTATSELTSLLEECVEKNNRLHEELRTCKEQIKNLQESGKECGLLKAENMKLKVQNSALQRQLAEMKDVEEKLKQLNHEKEELIVKVKYLEKQLAISRCRCERAKKPPPCLDPIKEETQRPCTPVVPKPKTPCCPCSQKKDHTHITSVALCVNKVNTNPPTDTDNVVTRKDSQIGGALGTLNLRFASINRMEGQIDQMITSVRRQNQRMNACNLSKFQSDKDIKECLTNLRHKREQLMGSLNKFKQELTAFECKTKARVCNCPKPSNPT